MLLLIASIASWTVIIEKSRMLKQLVAATDEFESRFWSGGDLASMYRDIAESSGDPLGQQGRRNHKNNQQHEHLVDVGHNVNLTHQADGRR